MIDPIPEQGATEPWFFSAVRLRFHVGPPLYGYAFSLGLILVAGLMRILIVGGGSTSAIIAPFFFFYPIIALSAFLAGMGPGLFAIPGSFLFVREVFHIIPAPSNWVTLLVIGPLFVVFGARLREVRDRNRALSRELERFKFIGDHASDWIFLLGDCGRIRYANRAACSGLGWPEAELDGKPIWDFVPEASRQALGEQIEKAKSGAVAPAEFNFRRPSGESTLVELSFTGVRAGDNHVVHVAARDITDRRQMEQKLREARLWESLGVMAGGLAHDFNNLLTSILGNAALARDLMPPGHEAHDMLNTVIASSERSAELVRLMLAVSGYRSRQTQMVDPGWLLASILANRRLPRNVIVLHSVSAEPFHGDLRSLETLFWSLISNAAESYGDAAGKVHVTVRSGIAIRPGPADFEEGEVDGEVGLLITVDDSGCGMSQELLQRAFDPFFSTKFTGRGLGLPAVRGIVRSYGGSFRIFTAPGRGTFVEICLPRQTDQTAG